MLGQILVTFITILVGVTLVPTVANTVFAVQYVDNGSGTNIVANVTGASAALIDLVPLFFVLGILVVAVQGSIAVLGRMGF